MERLSLEKIAETARRHRVTPQERRAQRVSMMMGLLPKETPVTRDEIVRFLAETEGVDDRTSSASPKAR
jgi:hypothetical protein